MDKSKLARISLIKENVLQPILTNLNQLRQVWANFDKFELILTSLNQFRQVWTYFDKFKLIQITLSNPKEPLYKIDIILMTTNNENLEMAATTIQQYDNTTIQQQQMNSV